LERIQQPEVTLYVEAIVGQQETLSEWQIKSLHRLVLKGIDDAYAGIYREEQVFISGARHVPPAHYVIQEKMEQMINWYEEEGVFIHPVERGALLHTIYVGIHPFIDGNVKTARLILNLELMKEGYSPVIIKVENRLDYYEALDKAHATEDYSNFVALVKKEVEDSLDLWLQAVK